MRDSLGKFVKGHPPLQSKETHWKWAGDSVGYSGVHVWVRKELGKPSRCDDCGDTSPRRYEWANISKEYKREVNDWKRLCRPCHHKFDKMSDSIWETRKKNGTDKGYTFTKKTQCKRGHEFNEVNTYYWRDTPFCRLCRAIREAGYANN